jgi:Putative Actinobacterial Holin-X, holin superfamily III
MASDLQRPPEPNVTAPVNGIIATDGQSPPERSVTTLVSGIIADAQQLIQQQFTMFRQEIRDDLRKTKEAALSLALGVGISLVGSVLLLLMLPFLLYWAVPALPLWACFGIVGGVLTTLGGALVYAGVKKIESFNPLSDQSAQTMKENLQWTTNPK